MAARRAAQPATPLHEAVINDDLARARQLRMNVRNFNINARADFERAGPVIRMPVRDNPVPIVIQQQVHHLIFDPRLEGILRVSRFAAITSLFPLVGIEVFLTLPPFRIDDFWVHWFAHGATRLAHFLPKVVFVAMCVGAIKRGLAISRWYRGEPVVKHLFLLEGPFAPTLAIASAIGLSFPIFAFLSGTPFQFQLTTLCAAMQVTNLAFTVAIRERFFGDPYLTRPAYREALRGYTPLHIAALMGHEQMVKLLLRAGADPVATTASGLTPLHIAQRIGTAEAATAALTGQRRPVPRPSSLRPSPSDPQTSPAAMPEQDMPRVRLNPAEDMPRVRLIRVENLPRVRLLLARELRRERSIPLQQTEQPAGVPLAVLGTSFCFGALSCLRLDDQ
eukprot:m.169690 g.169690  ORF g.169690 m.169690 type:complete len:392 (-) comp53231_c0_seq3:53-1228(-)